MDNNFDDNDQKTLEEIIRLVESLGWDTMLMMSTDDGPKTIIAILTGTPEFIAESKYVMQKLEASKPSETEPVKVVEAPTSEELEDSSSKKKTFH